MKKGDIVLIPFPFSDLSGNKLRPAIILISTVYEVTVCFITTQFQSQSKHDFSIIPTKLNGLKKVSLVRTTKIATLDKDMVLGRIGKMDQKYLDLLNHNLRIVLQLL